MVYEFAKYPDETLVVFSDIRKKENGEEYIRVSFERPTKKRIWYCSFWTSKLWNSGKRWILYR